MYEYDRGGNITSKKKYAYTTGTLGSVQQTIPYVYGDSTWKDKLTSYNGQTITYDAIGNPLSDGTWTYTWQAGRQLKKMTKSGVTVEFKYDHNGLRTQKKVTQNGVITTTNYTLHGKLVTHMTVGADKLHFFYDAQSRPTKVNFNNTVYTYLHNLQGDIVGIVDGNGTLVVEYNYDAWGKLLSTIGTKASTLGKLNPFRYRGYIYDEETGFYYLRSRYYSAELIRFINADTYIGIKASIFSHNLFAYCVNDCVNLVDHSGRDCMMYDDPYGGGSGGLVGTLGGSADFLTGVGVLLKRLVRRTMLLLGITGAGASLAGDVETDNSTSTKTKKKEPMRFPLNPYDFKPNGLHQQVYIEIGGKPNGGIIKWEVPGTKIAIFEWDEDYIYGPHYHVMTPEMLNGHAMSTEIQKQYGLEIKHSYVAGELVPEYWNTTYFGGDIP